LFFPQPPLQLLAPTQVTVIPIAAHKEGVMDKAYALKEELAKNFRTTIDDSDKGPGFKFAEAEMRGIPVRIEVGPKDIEAGQAVIVRRDTREKITVSFEELSAKVGEILETMQNEMLERARAHRVAQPIQQQIMKSLRIFLQISQVL